jgi:branched-chain amino acid aminotransferase
LFTAQSGRREVIEQVVGLRAQSEEFNVSVQSSAKAQQRPKKIYKKPGYLPAPYVYHNGEIRAAKDAVVSVASPSVQYGSTCFGGLKAFLIDGVYYVLRMSDHFERLRDATRILGWNLALDYSQFEELVRDLLEKNACDRDLYIRPFIYTNTEQLGINFDAMDFDFGLYMVELGDYLPQDRGLKLFVSRWRKFHDGAIPTRAKAGGTYLNSSLACTEAKAHGYDEALMLDDRGHVVEGSAQNILVVKHGQVYTPPMGSNILEGITLRSSLKILEQEGYNVQFRSIDKSLVYACDELLLTGTATQIVYAESVDGRQVGQGQMGPVCKALKRRFQAVMNQTDPMSPKWLWASK